MSFVEVISALVIIGLLSVAVLASVSVITLTTRATTEYTKMKIYATNKIETIQMDLELGAEGGKEPIDTVSYNDDGRTPGPDGEASGIAADVVVTYVGDVFEEPLYLVEMELYTLENGNLVRTSTLLREGCSAYAS